MRLVTTRSVAIAIVIMASTDALPTGLPSQASTDFSWLRLDAAHQQGLDKIRKADAVHKGAASIEAVGIMEKAGAKEALDAPLDGFSPNRAAAILNDFGFMDYYEEGISEKYYRRAIALDPNRKLAYLNLADLLYVHLPWASRWPDKEARAREAADDYRHYLSLGGASTPKIDSFLKGDLGQSQDTICDVAARYANAGRLGELVSQRADGVTTQYDIEDLSFEEQGTAHAPAVYAFKPGTTIAIQPPILPPGTENLWGGDHLGLFVYHDSSYILYYRDLVHPVSMKALTPGVKIDACLFSVRTLESTSPTALEPKLCATLQSGPSVETNTAAPSNGDDQALPASLKQVRLRSDQERGNVPARLRFTGKAVMPGDIVYEKHYQSSEVSTRAISFTNDGVSSLIGEFELASGAGAGCDMTFFDVLNASGTKFAEGTRGQLITQLQGTDLNGRYRMQCENNPRFFGYEGKIYFEDRPAKWPPTDANDQYHRVARVIDGKIEDVCEFSFNSTVVGRPN